MFAELTRPYKERTAKDTLSLISGILQELDMLPEETFQAHPYSEIFSTSIELPHHYGNFQTNGKGRNETYSRASAYAEFMERLQNGLYGSFSRSNQKSLYDQFGFYYAPDERLLSKAEFNALPSDVLEDIVRYSGCNSRKFIDLYFERISANGADGIISVPFWDTLARQVRYLPFNLLLLTVGSNGMAAGNTRWEAIYQAICELMERWGASLIFYNRLTPPTVPNDFLKNFPAEYEIIGEIEKSGKYQVIIKDFSAGQNIPSLGIIIRNLESDTYRLNVGSDTNFQVALSRCLTEVYQGFSDEIMFDVRLLPFPESVPPCFEEESADAMYMRYFIFGQFCKDNSGSFPPELFGSQPSYQFNPSTFGSRSGYMEEVRYLVDFLHRAGHTVYIRDVGFLGFPAVFVYVPEISAQGRKNVNLVPQQNRYNMIELDMIEDALLKVARLGDDRITECAEVLDSFAPFSDTASLFNVRTRFDAVGNRPPLAFVRALLRLKTGDYCKALENLDMFIAIQPTDRHYYTVCRRIIELMSEGASKETIKKTLLDEFDAPMDELDDALSDIGNHENLLANAMLPTCPDCVSCPLAADCLTRGQLAIAQKLYPLMKVQFPQQQEFAALYAPDV